MGDGIVRANDGIGDIDQSATGPCLQELRCDRLVGPGPIPLHISGQIIARPPFENAVQRITPRFEAVDDVTGNVGEEVGRAVFVQIIGLQARRRPVAVQPNPAGGTRLMAFHIAVFERARHQNAKFAVGKGVAGNQGNARVHIVGNVGIDRLRRSCDIGFAAIVERAPGNDAHGATDAAFRHVGRGGLDDFQPVDEFGGQVAEVDIAAAAYRGGQSGRAIDFDAIERRVGTADGHASAFAIGARKLHTGHALQRFADILVGEFADIFGRNRVQHLRRIALGVQRALQTAADTGDDDVAIARRLLLRGCRPGGKQKHSHGGARNQGAVPGKLHQPSSPNQCT